MNFIHKINKNNLNSPYEIFLELQNNPTPHNKTHSHETCHI